MAEQEWTAKTGSMTDVLIQVPVLTPYERAMVRVMEHNEHVSIPQVLEYLHWSKARGAALVAPYQPPLPTIESAPTVVNEALAVVENLVCEDMARPPFTPGPGEEGSVA